MPLKYRIPHPVLVVSGGAAVPALQVGGQAVAQQRQRLAAQPLLAGPPELDVPYWEQLGDEWCWAASAQMVLAFLGAPTPPPQQCELANLLLDLNICCDTPLPVPDCDQQCRGADVACIYNEFGRSAIRLHAMAAHATLEHEILRRRPVEVGLRPDFGSGHLVVVKWAGTEAGQPSVLINDPLSTTTSLLTYGELLHKGAVDSWIGIR